MIVKGLILDFLLVIDILRLEALDREGITTEEGIRGKMAHHINRKRSLPCSLDCRYTRYDAILTIMSNDDIILVTFKYIMQNLCRG